MPFTSRSSVLTTLAAAASLSAASLEAATEEAASLEAAEDAVEGCTIGAASHGNSQHSSGQCQTQSTIDSHVIVSFYSETISIPAPGVNLVRTGRAC